MIPRLLRRWFRQKVDLERLKTARDARIEKAARNILLGKRRASYPAVSKMICELQRKSKLRSAHFVLLLAVAHVLDKEDLAKQDFPEVRREALAHLGTTGDQFGLKVLLLIRPGTLSKGV